MPGSSDTKSRNINGLLSPGAGAGFAHAPIPMLNHLVLVLSGSPATVLLPSQKAFPHADASGTPSEQQEHHLDQSQKIQ